MGQRFVVHDLRRGFSDADRDDVRLYFSEVFLRLHNTQHAQTRVYTCRSWRSAGGATASYELHWNDESVPGETLLGSCASSPGRQLAERIEAEFSEGESVRLFTFNSDADLIIEEVLTPLR
jgi:hypothetical protein